MSKAAVPISNVGLPISALVSLISKFGDPIRAGVHRKWVAEAVYGWGAEKEEALYIN